MDVQVLLTMGVAGGGLYLGAAALKGAYLWTYEQYRRVQRDNLDIARQRQALALNGVRVLPADANGRQGIVYDGQTYRNLDTYAVFEQRLDVRFDALMERFNALQRVILASRGVAAPAARQILEPQVLAAPSPTWPARLDLLGLFADRRPSIHNLVIGARPSEGGRLDVVALSLHELMHTLTVGASGWGKSTWLRSLLWQVAKASEPIEIVAVDTSGSEFNILRDWGKLRWPVARTTDDAKAVLAGVSGEIDERRRLFESNAPMATKLTEYNEATGADLPPWLVVVDEGTSLLNQPGLGEPLRAAVQTARQYGVYILVAGQSAKYNVIDTQTRDNFSSRLCFRTSPTSSRVVLDDKAASDLTDRGRMIAQLVGKEPLELQGPFVTRQEFLAALTSGGPRGDALPAAPDPTDNQADVEAILTGYDETGTISGAARWAWGGNGSGDHFYKAKAILEEHGRV